MLNVDERSRFRGRPSALHEGLRTAYGKEIRTPGCLDISPSMLGADAAQTVANFRPRNRCQRPPPLRLTRKPRVSAGKPPKQTIGYGIARVDSRMPSAQLLVFASVVGSGRRRRSCRVRLV